MVMNGHEQSLSGFLLARIAEDEEAARKAERGHWKLWGMTVMADPKGTSSVEDGINVATAFTPSWCDGVPRTWNAAHMARHDPARVLAECEAKRRIVEAFEEERVRRDIYNRDYDSGEYDFNENDLRARLASNAHCRGLEEAMLALALPYADHPDYREEWRP